MTLAETIHEDLVSAMKTQDKFKLSTLRMLQSALQLEKISKKHDLSDEEVMAVIKKQVKVRKDSMEEYLSYNRNDLADNLKEEIAILSKYLPEELTEEELNGIIDSVFEELQPQSMKDMGGVMKMVSERVGARADLGTVSKLVKEKLS